MNDGAVLRVHACIVAYGASPHLDDLVDQLRQSGVTSIAIADNGATISAPLRDGAVDGCRVIDAGGNVGYARGIALAAALRPRATEAILVVNPDVSLDVAGVERLFAAHADLQPGLSSALLVERGHVGSNIRGATSLSREALKAAVGSRLAWRYRRGATHPSGAFMLISAKAWERLGGFDTSFELYYEDVELIDRYLSRGEDVHIERHVIGTHIGGTSSGGTSSRSFAVLRISRMRYLRGRYPRLGPIAGVLMVLIEAPIHLSRRQIELGTYIATLRSCVEEFLHPGESHILGSPA